MFRSYFIPRSYDLTRLPFEDAAGNQLFYGGEDNPYWTIKNNRFKDEINRMIGNVSLNYKFTNWLQADYKIGTDVYSTFRHGYDQIGARGGANTSAVGVGGVFETRNQYRALNSNFYLSFNKKFRNFTTAAIVGNEIQQEYNATAGVTGQGVIVRDFEQLKNTTTYFPSNGSAQSRLIGIYGDFTAGYKGIATLNATLRNDWSSTFLVGHQSYLYPAASFVFNITEALPSLKGKVVDNIKLRVNTAKVGKAGNILYGTDSYFVGASSSDGFGPNIAFPFNGLQGYTLSNSAGDANLGPEFTTSKEVGAELSFWGGRINIETNIYKTSSKTLIFQVPVSNTSGITSKITNIGKSHTNGVELALNLIPVKYKNGNWSINFNYTQFKTTIDELAPGVANIFLGGFTTPNIRLVVGAPGTNRWMTL